MVIGFNTTLVKVLLDDRTAVTYFSDSFNTTLVKVLLLAEYDKATQDILFQYNSC